MPTVLHREVTPDPGVNSASVLADPGTGEFEVGEFRGAGPTTVGMRTVATRRYRSI